MEYIANFNVLCYQITFTFRNIVSWSASCGLDVHQLSRPDRMQDNASHDRVNPIKGAIVFSNIVTTVSPTYAQEVRTAEGRWFKWGSPNEWLDLSCSQGWLL